MERAIAASDTPIFCNQIEYHPYISQGPPIAAARRHGLGLVAYSPLARGKVLKEYRLVEIGRKHGKSAAQVALRWLETGLAQGNGESAKLQDTAGRLKDAYFILDPNKTDTLTRSVKDIVVNQGCHMQHFQCRCRR